LPEVATISVDITFASLFVSFWSVCQSACRGSERINSRIAQEIVCEF